jgi:hypothetical protein
MELTVIEMVYQETLATMKRGLKPSLLVLGQRRYDQMKRQHYGKVDTEVGRLSMLGFEMPLVVVNQPANELRVYANEQLPVCADIPEPPFMFTLAPEARLETPMLHDLYPGHVYVAVEQKLEIGSDYYVRPQGKGCWLPSKDIVEIPYISVN